jgi:hypothetical protein
MRNYGKVAPQFWTGRTGKRIRALGGDAQRVALYLLTCPNATMTGLYYLPLPTLCHEVGISSQGALKALRSLSEADFACFDEPSEHVFVPSMARFQIGDTLAERDKRVAGVVNELLTMRGSRFLRDFVAKYEQSYHLRSAPKWGDLARAIEGASEPPPSQEQEQEQEQEQDPSLSCASRTARGLGLEGFDRFWTAYPRKVAKAAAQKAWKRVAPTASLLEQMLVVLEEAKRSDQWLREDGRYIPHASTWLLGQRWEDDTAPPLQPDAAPVGETIPQMLERTRRQRAQETA